MVSLINAVMLFWILTLSCCHVLKAILHSLTIAIPIRMIPRLEFILQGGWEKCPNTVKLEEGMPGAPHRLPRTHGFHRDHRRPGRCSCLPLAFCPIPLTPTFGRWASQAVLYWLKFCTVKTICVLIFLPDVVFRAFWKTVCFYF
jgi:hypothetical protein